jgi:uncharacterized protein
VKLPVVERETAPLRSYLTEHGEQRRAASALVRTELRRAVLRAAPDRLVAVPRLLAGLALVPLDDALLDSAGALPTVGLRSVDALHIASALRLAPVSAVITYDVRMQDAARDAGLHVLAPSG